MNNLFQTTNRYTRHLTLAFLIGIAGGIVSALVKSGVETLLPPRTADTLPPPIILLKDFGVDVNHTVYEFMGYVVNWGGNGVHILFSIVCAIIYGMLAEIFPKVKMVQGLIFGLGVAIVAHGIILPTFGLSAPVWDLPVEAFVSEFVGTAFWIWTIEVFRQNMRARITHQPDAK